MDPEKSRKFLKILSYSAALIAGAVFITGALAEPNRLVIKRPTLTLPELPAAAEGLRILLVADPHFGGTFADLLRRNRIIKYARREKPDICFLLGDYIAAGSLPHYGAMEKKELVRFFSALKAPMGTFAVLGNHELWYGRKRMVRILEDSGIHFLENKKVKLPCGLALAGIPDGSTAPFDAKGLNAMIRDEKNLLLLSHKGGMLKYLRTAPENIMFAADTHGGQIRLPGIGSLKSFMKGEKELAPGLSKRWNKQLYITTGAGGHRWGFRLFCPPEIVLVTLKKGKVNNL